MAQVEKVVMTPKCKTANSTTLIIERQAIEAEANDKVHVAGGDHTGIIINKEQKIANGLTEPCHNQLEFRVYLVNAANGNHTREARCLRFWFKPQLPPNERAQTAQNFFRELVSPQDFPRDYVGFIKKIIKLMQNQFIELRLIEVELRQEGSGPPPKAFIGDTVNNHLPAISEDKVLEFIESAYPNPITIDDFVARSSGKWTVEEVKECLQALEERGLAKALSPGSYTRQHSVDTKIVGQMPTISSARQPTIAVITALFCEKLAVDSMMDNQETYVRYTTIGESNVYTLGTIGSHRVVSTKLPTVGHTREAMTAAGNTTTRLLGTFQKVDYVFLVGVGGGVPHYTDYDKHVRLGDVVVSTSPEDIDEKYVYMYCEKATPNNIGGWDYEVKPYRPASFYLQDIALQLCQNKEIYEPWNEHYLSGLSRLSNETQQWTPPGGDSDRLCVNLGDGAVIEVSHPTSDRVDGGKGGGVRRVLCAAVCGGRAASEAGGSASGAREASRAHFAAHARALAFDCELDAAVESVIGNRRDCFVSIRGISDYWDGTRGRDWQPHASLAAASVMKAIICAMAPPSE